MRLKRLLCAVTAATSVTLALVACGSVDATQSGRPDQAAEHTDDISAGVQPDPAAVKLLPESVKAKGKISVAMDLSSPPTTFLAKDNKTPIGFNPDMARLIAAKLGVKLQ
ncbi:amino acid ABC transporter substrate-binding protein, partial [Lentzea sp. PSKA42]